MADRVDISSYKTGPARGGVWHCEPPADILEDMLFARVHLDNNTADRGSMEIDCSSHQTGLVPAKEAEQTANTYNLEITDATAADVLTLPML